MAVLLTNDKKYEEALVLADEILALRSDNDYAIEIKMVCSCMKDDSERIEISKEEWIMMVNGFLDSPRKPDLSFQLAKLM